MTDQTILLLNRDTAFLDHTGAILREAGYSIRTAMDMRSALSILSTHTVGLIICEKALEDVSGYDLLNFIKKDPLRDKIPFMFLVSARDQGRAFTAFELGAVDFMVYPLDNDVLTARIGEILADAAQPVPQPEKASPVAVPAPMTHQDEIPGEAAAVVSLKVDVSRDGVLWLPGKLGKFRRNLLFVDTGLFAKPGVSLMMRFKLADGIFVVNGLIKNISFNDFQKPAGIEMEAQEDETWRRIHAYLLDSVEKAAPASGKGESGDDPAAIEKTILMDPARSENAAFRTGPFQRSSDRDPSYDLRFYHSLIGKQLDNYRAITLIGAGSMGGVMQGWDVALEREVALKVISYELSSKEKFREMFIKEARVVSRLNHLNIAQIYYIGTSNDILYYAMEFVDGRTLKDVIATDGRLKTLKGLEYLITVSEALHYVHQNSIVHRDMKPANIMINGSGAIKILDFGVAKTSDSGKADKSQIIGSPLYMSPEQVAGLTLDHRSDIYSVGATFYHAFTGSPPFEADDFKVIMAQHIEKPLPPMKDKNPHTPPALAKIIEKMMAKDPFDRFKDFHQLSEELKALRGRILDLMRQPTRAIKS